MIEGGPVPGPPQSARLRFRPVRISDAECLFAFLGDPAAMRFTYRHESLRACRRRLAAFEWTRRSIGYAPWVVMDHAADRLIGWGGVFQDPFEPDWGPELGYAFHPHAWGRGLATELARICLEWADGHWDLPEIRAFAHPDNAASRRVLDKAGFSPVRIVPKMQRILFRRPRPTARPNLKRTHPGT